MSFEARKGAPARPRDRRALLRALLTHEARAERTGPLSLAQERLWFLDQFDPRSAAYNVVRAFRLAGRLDVASLQHALDTIVERQTSLRTTFASVDGRAVQIVGAGDPAALTLVDLSGLQGAERESTALQRATEEAEQPFDLGRGPLFRALLLRLGTQEHILLLSLHHIVSDGWSMGVLLRELSSLYAARIRGESSPLPELPLQYLDFAIGQRRGLQGARVESLLGYWRPQLLGAAPLQLPTDRPRPAKRSSDGRRLAIAFGPGLAAALKAFGQGEAATLFMTLLAGFQSLLARYSGQTDVVVGCPIANRTQGELEGLIGFFANILVLRTDFRGDPSFREVVRRVREAARGAYAHQDLPFERLVDELRPERSLDRNPLFQVAFALQNTRAEALALPGVAVRPAVLERSHSKFDLTLSLEEAGGGLEGFLEYSTDLFDSSTVERMLVHYRRLLEGAVAHPDRPVSELALLAEGERRQALLDGNPTPSHYPSRSCLHELFEAQAGRTPEAVALVFGEDRLAYAELDRRSNQLGRYLRKVGVRPEARVGLCVERSAEMVVGMLGILKAGGAYLPLDPACPPERLAFMLRDGEVEVVVTQESLRGRLPEPAGRLVSLDADWLAIAEHSGERLESGADAEALAYVIYTSGSTGEPKGVAVPHRAVSRLVLDTNYIEFGSGEVVAQASTTSFDAATFEIWGPLLHGDCLVGVSREVTLAPVEFAAELRERGVTVLFLTTALFNALAREAPGAFSGLRTLLFGGEAVDPRWVRAVLADRPPRRLLHVYGPTEATTFATWHRVESVAEEARTVPIGGPLSNTTAYVLDARMEPVPAGIAGELYLGGHGLARGYWNRPDLTAERFLPDPFSGEPGRRLYRTGDLAKRRADGAIEYLRRVDRQVKLRGFRIEPAEVEAAIGQHPSVREAAVLVREDASGARRLVAHVVWREGAASPWSELRGHLRRKLPDYMVPAAFSALEGLPLSPNGKVDRSALGRLEIPTPEVETVAEAGTEVEARLTEIWKEVLGLDRVGVEENFFELGGDSILSIQLTARANRAGLRLTPNQLFQNQTIRELAAVVEPTGAALPARTPGTGAIPLTPIQQWFFELGLPDSNHFNQWLLLEAKEELDPARLEEALRQLGEHHEALNLTYHREGTAWRQAPAGSPVVIGLVQEDLAGLSDPEQAAALRQLAASLHGSLDVSRGPLWRAALLHRGPGRADWLLLLAHHLVVDGVSWRILLEDLETAYRSQGRGDTFGLAARTTSFGEWARRLCEYGRSGAVERHAAYWLERARIRGGVLPRDRPDGRVGNDFASARRVSVWLGAAETARLLREVPKAYGTGIDETLLAAIGPALARWTRAPTLLLDLERHGREDVFEGVDLSRTVGWFTSLYPVVLELQGAETPHRALTIVKEQLRSVPEQGLSYGLLRYLGASPTVGEALRAQPQAEIGFNYLGQFDQVLGGGSLFRFAPEMETIGASAIGPRPHLLGISARVSGGRLRVDWNYNEEVHRRETIEALAGQSLDSLRSLIRHCESPGAGGYTPSDFPLARLGQGALERLLGAERGIEAVYPLSPMQQGMHFHARVEPDSIAYFVQITQILEGDLEAARFKLAWEQVAARHAVLRSAFLWQGLDEPLQVVRHEIALPWEEQDWRGAGAAEQALRLRALLEADRARRVDLTKAPAWRLALIRLEEQVHQVVWSFPHLLLDGWSLPLVLNEVFARYEGLRLGVVARLPPARPYQDFVRWLGGQDPGAAEAFWRQELKGFTVPTTLGLEVPRAAGPEERHGECAVQLGPERTGALQSLARNHQVTLSAVLQGAWALLLGRYSGQDDVVFGATVSGRPPELEDVETMVGVFINTLPVRVELEEDEPLGPFLERLHRRQLERLQHQHTPLAKVQRWSDVPEAGGLFESILLFENYPEVGSLWSREGSLRVRDLRGHEESSYPLTVVVVPRDGLWVRIKYDRRRFEPVAVERLLKRYQRLLERIPTRPEAPLSELSLLDESERRQLLTEWNDTRTRYPRDAALHRLFEAQADRSPQAVALVFGAERLSYRELNSRANGLAHHLRDLGVGPEARVGVCLERSAAMVVGMLAALKAGGAYVPLDPTYPQERLAFMVRDAGVGVILTQQSLRAPLSSLESVALVCVDSDGGVIAVENKENLAGDSPAEALAYVIYTSGSTGEPKGVGIPHRAVSRLILDTNYIALGPRSVVVQASNASFDAATFEVWGPLLHGGRLVGIDREVTLSPREFATRLRENEATVLFLTTALFNRLAREAPEAFSGLETLLFGGEAVDPRAVRAVLEGPPPERLLHVYGPTESTTFATWNQVTEVAAEATTVPIGRPISNTTTYVLDSLLNPVPIGLTGELHIGGDGLARGYLNRPDLTAERFVPDPFGRESGARLYKTGDRVRQRGDGSIEFLGRADHQVKLRGFRIELGEIEAILSRHSAVRDVVAIVREDEPGDRRLVAYVVLKAPSAVTAAELRAYLGRRLPDHMVPSACCVLDALPLGPSGKVARRALPAPGGGPRGVAGGVPPRDALEERIAAVWREVLRRDPIGIDENFFDIGGDSLRIVSVFARLAGDTNERFPLVTLFQHPTVRSLAAFLSGESAAAGEAQANRDRQGSRRAAIAHLASVRPRRTAG